jgi:hypothetical protein
MWTMSGGETALLALAVALTGWLRRNIVIELATPFRVGPFTIQLRSSEERANRSDPISCRGAESREEAAGSFPGCTAVGWTCAASIHPRDGRDQGDPGHGFRPAAPAPIAMHHEKE